MIMGWNGQDGDCDGVCGEDYDHDLMPADEGQPNHCDWVCEECGAVVPESEMVFPG
jgi:hypothetical protein